MDKSGVAIDHGARFLNVGSASVDHNDFGFRQQAFEDEQGSWEKSSSDDGNRANRRQVRQEATKGGFMTLKDESLQHFRA